MRSLTAIQNPMQYQAQTQGVQSPLMRMPNGRNVMVPSDTGMSGANPHSAPPRAGATRMRLNDQTATLAAADGSTAAAGPKSPPPPPPSDGGTSTQGGSR